MTIASKFHILVCFYSSEFPIAIFWSDEQLCCCGKRNAICLGCFIDATFSFLYIHGHLTRDCMNFFFIFLGASNIKVGVAELKCGLYSVTWASFYVLLLHLELYSSDTQEAHLG